MGKILKKTPPAKKKIEKHPSLSTHWSTRPGAELASRLDVGNGAVSEAGNGAPYIGKMICG